MPTIRSLCLIVAAAIAAAATVASSQAAMAAGPLQNIALSPSSTLITVQPGASVTKSISIINAGTDNFSVDLNASPYHVEGDNYDPQFTQLPGTLNAAKWVTLSKLHLPAVTPHATATVPYTVSVPAGTPAGGYYAVIFAETGSEPGSDSTGVQAHSRVGDILYITVAGPVKESGTLINVPLPGLIVGSTVTVSSKVNNTGGIHFLSTFTTDIKDSSGKLVFHSSVDRYILPQTTRLVSQSWTPSAFAGIYKVSRSATVAGHSESLPDETVVFVKPQLFPIVGFSLLTLIGLFILLRQIHRRH